MINDLTFIEALPAFILMALGTWKLSQLVDKYALMCADKFIKWVEKDKHQKWEN